MFKLNGQKKPGPANPRSLGIFDGLLRGTGVGVPVASRERFPTSAEIAADPTLRLEAGNPHGKIFLGLTGAQILQEAKGGAVHRWATGGSMVAVADDRHLISFAQTRGGKGRALINTNLTLFPGSVIAYSAKGDLAEMAKFRALALGQRVRVFDPFGVSGSAAELYLGRWNPLRLRGDEDADALIDLASLVADSLVIPGGKEPHWDDTARELIEGVTLHVLTSPAYEQRRTLRTVYELLMTKAEDGGGEKPSTLEAEMVGNPAAGGAVAFAATAFYDKEGRERSGVLSTARRHLHFLAYPKVARALGDGDIDLHRVQSEPTTIFLTLPATKLRTCAGLPRMFVNLLLNALEFGSDREAYQHRTGHLPLLLCLDEFATLRIERLADMAGLAAGLGCKLWPILQDYGQLKSVFGDRAETFMANAGVLTFFGNQDLTTLEWLEKRLGQTTVLSPSRSSTSIDAALRTGATGEGYSVGSHPLLSVPELARIFNRDDPHLRMLVISASHGPMILQRAFYDKHEAFLTLRKGEKGGGRGR